MGYFRRVSVLALLFLDMCSLNDGLVPLENAEYFMYYIVYRVALHDKTTFKNHFHLPGLVFLVLSFIISIFYIHTHTHTHTHTDTYIYT